MCVPDTQLHIDPSVAFFGSALFRKQPPWIATSSCGAWRKKSTMHWKMALPPDCWYFYRSFFEAERRFSENKHPTCKFMKGAWWLNCGFKDSYLQTSDNAFFWAWIWQSCAAYAQTVPNLYSPLSIPRTWPRAWEGVANLKIVWGCFKWKGSNFPTAKEAARHCGEQKEVWLWHWVLRWRPAQCHDPGVRRLKTPQPPFIVVFQDPSSGLG